MSDYENIPEGWYDAQAVKQNQVDENGSEFASFLAFSQTKNGKDFVGMRFQLVGGEYNGRTLWKNFFPVGKGGEFMQKALSLMFHGRVQDFDNQTPRVCRVLVQPEEYEGKTYDRIQAFAAGGGGTAKADSGARNRMMAQMSALGSFGEPPAAPTPNPADDDLPF